MRIHSLALSLCLLAASVFADSRPNILWITVEDMSPTLGCYGDSFAQTPHIDAFCKQSVAYDNAFASSPVCSPSRACLINGLAASSQGTHPMRSVMPLPESMLGFPALLRQKGYYTTNNVKTDYNSGAANAIVQASWDESSSTAGWRNRTAGQPFFSVINLMTTHQSRTMVWPYDQFQKEVQSQLKASQISRPADVPVPPYYPDTPLIRKTIARFYDCVTAMDGQVQEILQQLRNDGLDKDTIVFFYSDHGSGMPRHKRALLDTGMKVPLIIRFPEKYQSLAPAGPGERVGRLVSFADFGPTVLSLLGIEQPSYMQGQAFLPPDQQPERTYVYGHRDRVDEIQDMARSVRDKRFLYVRNYMPHLGYNQQSAWIDQGEIRSDFYRYQMTASTAEPLKHFLNPKRPVEELYDCQADPLNLINLTTDNRYQADLQRLRRALQRRLVQSKDLGIIPELELIKISKADAPYRWARKNLSQQELRELYRHAGGGPWGSADAFTKAMKSSSVPHRYWSVMRFHQSPLSGVDLTAYLDDPAECVQIEIAGAIAQQADHSNNPGLVKLRSLLSHSGPTVILHAARTVELLGDRARSLVPAMQALLDRYEDVDGDEAWFIRFTTTGFLSRIKH